MKTLKIPGKIAVKRALGGTNQTPGIGKTALIYFFLIGIGFIYIYPVLYMVINSIFSPDDLVDPAVTWIPTAAYFGNYIKAWNTLEFGKSFFNSLYTSILPTLFQTAATALIGYGFARFKFPLKNLWLALVVMTFVIPSQITLVPRYIMYHSYGFINTPLPAFVPALLGQGIKSAVFILIFYQFFRSYPAALDEAAAIDGASKWKIFYKIALPMASSATVLSILFSLVWYWNETSQSSLYFGSVISTLPMKLNNFAASYQSLYNQSNLSSFNRLNESISLAGTALSVLPLIVLYLCLQKQFVESIERSGITGE